MKIHQQQRQRIFNAFFPLQNHVTLVVHLSHRIASDTKYKKQRSRPKAKHKSEEKIAPTCRPAFALWDF